MADTRKSSSGDSDSGAGEDATFDHEQLIAAGPEAFGVARHTVAGALANVQKQNLTRDEAQKAINKYLEG